jgi:hypothetical protein
MKLSEFADLIGASKQAVSKACTSGRLARSVTRDAHGRVVDIDAKVGLEEWPRALLPRSVVAQEARGRAANLAAATPDAAEVSRRLAQLIENDLTERNRLVLQLVPQAVAGAAEVLAAAGRAGELAKALHLDDEDAGVALAVELLAVADGERDGELGGDRAALARDVGREAARAALGVGRG